MARSTSRLPDPADPCVTCGGPKPARNARHCSRECEARAHRIDLADEEIDQVEQLAADGLSERGIARRLGFRRWRTYCELKKRDERIAEAVATGRARMVDDLVAVQKKRALDPKHPQGFLATTHLLNSAGYGAENRRDDEPRVRLVVELPTPAASLEEYRARVIDVTPQRAALPAGDGDEG